jgi:GT2 family glycosyltransferase
LESKRGCGFSGRRAGCRGGREANDLGAWAAWAVEWVSGASMMIRWSVIDEIGGFDENQISSFEETDFCRRYFAINHGLRYAMTPDG